MLNNHLTYFKIENFKKFDSLEVNDIGQFNLIVGDNNVGKTCLLEALLFDQRPKNTISWYHELLVKRRLVSGLLILLNETNNEKNFETNTFAHYQKEINKEIKFILNKVVYSIENKNEEIGKTTDIEIKKFIKKEGLFDFEGINKKSKNWIVFKINNKIIFLLDLTSTYYEDFINRPQNSKIPNIPALMLNDEIEHYLGKHYDKIFISLDLGKNISDLITLLFPNIEIIEFQKQNETSPLINDFSLKIKTKERNRFHNIREYGEGFVRSLYMIIQLLSCNSNKIIIDEVDTGIHHTKLKEVWKTLFKLCLKMNIQLFATTHSHECAKAYVEASKEININSYKIEGFKLIELFNSDNKTKSFVTSGIENIEYAINNEPYRGENDYDV